VAYFLKKVSTGSPTPGRHRLYLCASGVPSLPLPPGAAAASLVTAGHGGGRPEARGRVDVRGHLAGPPRLNVPKVLLRLQQRRYGEPRLARRLSVRALRDVGLPHLLLSSREHRTAPATNMKPRAEARRLLQGGGGTHPVEAKTDDQRGHAPDDGAARAAVGLPRGDLDLIFFFATVHVNHRAHEAITHKRHVGQRDHPVTFTIIPLKHAGRKTLSFIAVGGHRTIG